MKIRLLVKIPVPKEHGMKKGRECEVIRDRGAALVDGVVKARRGRWLVMGDAGIEIPIFEREAEVIEE